MIMIQENAVKKTKKKSNKDGDSLMKKKNSLGLKLQVDEKFLYRNL